MFHSQSPFSSHPHFDIKRYPARLARRVAVAAAFLCSLIAYLLTLEPDASYWDCPEYLVTAANLEIGHPPGNPLWTLTARIFSLFGGSSPQSIAVAVNISSALFTALAVALLANVIFIILRRLRLPSLNPSSPSASKRRNSHTAWIQALCAWSGAMCFGWSDSPWFSAVEAEVYAMSLFLTALTVRLMLGWMMMPAGNKSRRYLLLIVYLTGLSIGVHQLNLLVIPALALMWLFRRQPRRVGPWRILIALLLGAAAVGIILLGMMPGALKVAGEIELFCVNSFHLPLHSGVWLFWGLALLIFWTLPFCIPAGKSRLQLLAWIPALLLTGYSCYMLILVRGAAQPPMNEGDPSNIFALQSYLGRDQYGSTPLFYGRTPHSKILRREEFKPDGTPDYSRNALEDISPKYAPTDSGYVLYEYSRKPIYTPELNMFFPRLVSSNADDIKAYSDWAGMTSESMTEVEVSYALDSLGRPVGKLLPDGSRVKDKELRPTYLHQIRYLFGYQIGYMYFRYLLWNYSGKQNDRFSAGEVEHGNFITGFPFLDDLMLGPQDMMPEEIGRDNPGRNVYFMIPLIMGILGMIALQRCGRRGRRWNLILTVLFLMTGVAIVVYLNQSPGEPRERDYSFLGSFWTFAIWIAAGVALLFRIALNTRAKRLRQSLIIASALFATALPLWMLYQNYDDHDRSRRTGVTDFAANLLESLEPNAILFTNGDNYTFPLWWAQEVAGVRPDVTIINIAYLSTPWYVNQLRIDNAGAKGLRLMMPADQLKLGGFKYNPIAPRPTDLSDPDLAHSVDARVALADFYSSKNADRLLPPVLRMPNPYGGDSICFFTSDLASGSRRLNLFQLASLDIILSNSAYANGDNPVAASPIAKRTPDKAPLRPRPVYWMSATRAADIGAFRKFTTRMLHSRMLIYRDSLGDPREDSLSRRLLDWDWKHAMLTRSGRLPDASGRDRDVYADDTYGSMVTSQRQDLLRFGGRLLKAGRRNEAGLLASFIDSIFPASIREYQIYAETDSVIDEGLDLARLYLEASSAKDDPYRSRGLTLLNRERDRYLQWKAYREALPPHLRDVMTPKNLRKSRRLPVADSLILHYSSKW